MSQIKNIGVHHFAGKLTLAQVNALHRKEWPDMPSKLRPDLYVGYNFIIWDDGSWTQCRYIGEETCAQVGHNFDTVSVSLYGNFSKTLPNARQIETLTRFLAKLTAGDLVEWAVLPGTLVNIPKANIYPHRILQPNHTECYGNLLSDKWALNLLMAIPAAVPAPAPLPFPLPTTGPEWTRLMQSFQDLLELFRRKTGLNLGGPKHCYKGARG